MYKLSVLDDIVVRGNVGTTRIDNLLINGLKYFALNSFNLVTRSKTVLKKEDTMCIGRHKRIDTSSHQKGLMEEGSLANN